MYKLNIVIPAFNEEDRLPETLNELDNYLNSQSYQMETDAKLDVKLIVVNDGSTDETESKIRTLLKETDIQHQIISYKENQGKGYAVKIGMLDSRPADLYYLADSDLSSPWSTMTQLINHLKNENDSECVIGSRAMPTSDVNHKTSRLVSGRASNFLINLFLGLGINDTQCGYKLFSKRCIPAFEQQKLNRFGFDFEILYLIQKLDLKIKEVGIEWENKAGSKVKPSDYVNTFTELFKVRFLNKYDV